MDVAGGDLAVAAEAMHAVTELEGYHVRPAEVTVLAPGRLSVTIHEGRNRQVRRLCALAGLRVRRLVRVAEGSCASARSRRASGVRCRMRRSLT